MATYRSRGGGGAARGTGGSRGVNERTNRASNRAAQLKSSVSAAMTGGAKKGVRVSAKEAAARAANFDKEFQAFMDKSMNNMNEATTGDGTTVEEKTAKLKEEVSAMGFEETMKASEERMKEFLAKHERRDAKVAEANEVVTKFNDSVDEQEEGGANQGMMRVGMLTDAQVAEHEERMKVEGFELKAPLSNETVRVPTDQEVAFNKQYKALLRRKSFREFDDGDGDGANKKGEGDDEGEEKGKLNVMDVAAAYMRPRIDMDKTLGSYSDDFPLAPPPEDEMEDEATQEPFNLGTAKLTSDPPTVYNHEFPVAPDVHTQLLAKEQDRPDGTLPYYVKVKVRLMHPEHRLLDKWAVKWREKLQTLVVVDQHGDSTPAFRVPGCVWLPTKQRKWTILASPFVHKKARTQLELNTHRRLITAEATGSRNRIRESVELVERAVNDQSDYGNTQETDNDMFRSHIGYFRMKYKE